MQGKKAAIILLLLTVLNLVFFIFRDSFQYQPYSGYKDLYGSCGKACENKWKKYREDYPAAELVEARRITDSVLAGKPTDEYSKALAIGRFLYERFYRQLGTPDAGLLSSTPLAQYKKLSSSDSSELWCGNFAQIFSYFCWSQGIICRNIEIMNPGDHHVLNEVYLPSEEKWMMADLTNNQLAVLDEKNSVLDLVSYRRAVQSRGSLFIIRSDKTGNEKFQLRDYSSLPACYRIDHPLFYYHRVDNKKVYSLGNKLVRYFLPVSWYDIFDDKGRSNVLFYTKGLLILLWLISFFVFIRTGTKFRI